MPAGDDRVDPAPEIARERKPGQFVIVQTDTEFGERIPLTISDANPAPRRIPARMEIGNRLITVLVMPVIPKIRKMSPTRS